MASPITPTGTPPPVMPIPDAPSTLPSSGNQCGKCGKVFSHPNNRIRHQHMCKGGEKYSCDMCGTYQTSRRDNLKRHKLVCLKRLSNAIIVNICAATRKLTFECASGAIMWVL